MRFGRRSGSWNARRIFGENADRNGESGTVASDERSALLQNDDEPDPGQGPSEHRNANGNGHGPRPGADEPARDAARREFKPDPTQQLLTTLGRFQRHLSRAHQAEFEGEWVDECMEQLIGGIEIAMGEHWEDVHQALTDTARVLQSYEDVGRAQDCLPFLEDSYEILCLMVGDIIVDNVRSGVLQKWTQRYTAAVSELEDAGIALVDDEGEPLPPQSHAPAVIEVDAFGFEAADEEDDEGDEDVDEEAFAEDTSTDAAPPEEFFRIPSTPDDADEEEDVVGSYFLERDEQSVPASAEDDEPAYQEAAATEAVTDEENWEGDDLFAAAARDVAEEEAPRSKKASLFDLLEQSAELPLAAANVAAIEEQAPPVQSALGESLFDAMDAVIEPALGSTGEDETADEILEAEVVELVEEFDEAPPTPVMVESSAPVAVSAPAQEPEPEPGSPEALLRSAGQVLAAGNVGDAKVAVLALAVRLAELEVDRAQAKVGHAEALIEQNRAATSEAEEAVALAMQKLEEAEIQLGERRAEQERTLGEQAMLEERQHAKRSEIADIERQIAELQARCEAERIALTEIDTEHAAVTGRLKKAESSVAESEGHTTRAQELLTDAKTQVEQLQAERNDCEAAIAEANALLEEQRGALQEILRTRDAIAQTRHSD